jgi:crotonobetainyl-CoA:carnitine CoA-transferase CaiB-like acyl-CoA transferase
LTNHRHERLTMQDSLWRPFADIKVLDFSTNLPGPMATSVLCDLGALVIKVEAPGGDPSRKLASGLFGRVNRGKRGLTLDLEDDRDRRTALRMAQEVDIVVETFRPGVADRLGIGYEALRACNEDLIYCSLSGFGAAGPLSQNAGHDLSYLALAGAMTLPGRWADPPQRSGLPVADLMAGMMTVNAIGAALYDREQTGKGRHLDVSLFEAALYCVGIRAGFGEEPATGQLHPSNDMFDTQDGKRVALTIVEDHFWARFAAAVAKEDPELSAERFSSLRQRRANGAELRERLTNVMRRRTRDEWVKTAHAADFALEPVLTPAEAIRHPHVTSRRILRTADGKPHLPLPVISGAARVAPATLDLPELGVGREAALASLGLTEQSIP